MKNAIKIVDQTGEGRAYGNLGIAATIDTKVITTSLLTELSTPTLYQATEVLTINIWFLSRETEESYISKREAGQ